MYFESSSDGFIFVHKKQKVHSVDAKKTIVKKVKNIVHLILTFKMASFKHKFASKPEVIDGNMKALEMALKEVK